MSSTQNPFEKSPANPPRTPICLACGKEMQIVLSEPSQHFRNLAERTHKCECGESTSRLVRKE